MIAAPPEPAVRDSRRRAGGRELALILLLAAAVLVLFALLNALAAHDVLANSDSATVALEGQSLTHGNLALSGWSLSLDSFWTVDALFYALGSALIGFTPALVHAVPAVIALLVICLGVIAARLGLARRGSLVAGGVVVALLGLPSHALATFFLQGPWHIATALWCLAAFVALSRGAFGWRFVIAVVFLAAGLLGDLQTVGMGVAPVALAGLVAAARTRRWRAGAPALAAAGASVLVALAVRALTSSVGAFSYHESHHTAPPAQMWSNLGHLGHWGAALLGVVRGSYGGALPLPIALAHLLVAGGLVVAVAGAAVAMILGVMRGKDGDEGAWRLDDLLLLGVVGDLVLFEVLTLSKNPGYARYLTPALILAVVLAARLAGRLAESSWSTMPQRLTIGLVLGCLGAFAAGVALDLRQPVVTQPALPVEAFLSAHHLTHGVGDYWAASVLTLESHGAITVRPVVADPSGTIVRDGRQSDASWYRGQHYQFLVYQRAPFGRVSIGTILHTFGMPAEQYTLGKYYVLVWSHLLTLPPGEFP